MKKIFIPAALLGAVLAAAPCLSALPVRAAEPVNVLATKSDWAIFTENKSKFEMTNGAIEIIPTSTDAGATYVAHSYKNAVIEFDYQVSYDPDVDPYHEDQGALLPGSFFGIIFGNNVNAGSDWKGIQTLPWSDGGKGGYPYVLAFDTERQTSDQDSLRYTQVGLSLRRYKVSGTHSYAGFWSTVDPADGEYLCSDGENALSIVPAFSKPVKVSDCFDTDAHKVKIDYRAQYASMGAEKDAMAINVWFDDDLVLTVIDEMPFKGESWGAEIDVDKRDKDGYIGIFAHHASVDSAELYDWKVNISNMTVADLGAVNPNASNGDGGKGKGCSGSAAGVFAVAAAVPVAAAVLVVVKKRRGNV